MISKIKQEKKHLLILFVLITCTTLAYFSFAIIKQIPITYGTDLKPQWFEFFTEFKRMIINLVTNKTLPFYSWSTFLGNDFYASKSFNLTGDIYSYLGLLLNDNFFIMASELTYIKFVVSGFTFYLLLTEFDRTPKTKVICSFVYVFSGWAILFSGHLVFLSFYSLVPLYILGIERYLKYNKWILFAISCCLLFSVNWYFFYTISVFSPVYFLYRYFSLEIDIKKLLKSIIKLIGIYLLGSMISAFIWLPGIIYILDSTRISSSIGMSFNLTEYLNIIYSSFIPNYLYIYKENIFEIGAHYTREICLWSSTCLLLLVPQFTNIFNKKRKLLTYGVYAIFLIIALTPSLDSFVHGFGDPSFRWTFVAIIFNLIIISEVLDNLNKINNKKLFITSIVYICIMLGTFVFALIYKNSNIEEYSKQLLITIIFICVIVVAGLLINRKKINLYICLIILEIVISGSYCYYENSLTSESFEQIDQLTHTLQDYYGEVNDSLNALNPDNEKQFYRIYVPVYEVYGNFSHNMSLHYGIKGLMTYDSTYAPSFNSMLSMCFDKISSFGSNWLFDIKDNSLMTFLNTKYAIVTSNMKMDGENWKLIDDNYHYGFHLYENTDYRPLGTTYSEVITEEEYKENKDTSLFIENVIIDEKEINIEEIESMVSDANGYTYNISHYDNTLVADYYADKDGFMVITIPYDKGWKIIVDGEQIDYYPVNGGFIGFTVLEGTHRIEMYFVPPGFKIGCILTMASTLAFITLCIIEKRKLNHN